MNKRIIFVQSLGSDMRKLYTKNINGERSLFIGILGVLFLVGTLLFHPTLNILQKFTHQQKVNDLISDIKKPNFNMREYWQFREFYSAGNFSFDPEIVSLAGALQFNNIPESKATLLTFKSPSLESTDSIINIERTGEYPQLTIPNEGSQNVLLKSKDTVVYQSSDKKMHFVFVKSSAEMKQTLGLFDYGANEDKILASKMWLNETTLSE